MSAKEYGAMTLDLLTGLVRCNLAYLARNPKTPHPYLAGIRYKREAKGQEEWWHIGEVLRHGYGDCEDLTAYLAAYLLHHKQGSPELVVRWYLKPKRRLFHVLVKNKGSYEDPSKELGMGAV